MKSLLTYFKLENISHPAVSDIELGTSMNESFSKHISDFISKIFESEHVTFKCQNNEIMKTVTVISESKQLQIDYIDDKKFASKIIYTNEPAASITRTDKVKSVTDIKEHFKTILEQINE